MTLARRTLVRFNRPFLHLYRPSSVWHRCFAVSHIRRQAVEEAPAQEGVESLNDAPVFLDDDTTQVDWSRSFHGLSTQPFSEESAKILTAPIGVDDVEIKPGTTNCCSVDVDGIIYLPEIKYRRILNRAFGPGGWGLAPRSETTITPKSVSREYALVCHGRLVSVARGEQDYFEPGGIATATEGCKSNALMRCCKDLGIASELWDPRFIRKFKREYCVDAFAEHVVTKRVRKLWRRKDDEFEYPFKEKKGFTGSST